jgi:hypothetical protein
MNELRMEFYSDVENEILSFAGEWIKLENIILSEVSQVRKAKGHMFSLICVYRPNTNTSIIHIHTNIYRTYTQK